jgi:hypothetical protein
MGGTTQTERVYTQRALQFDMLNPLNIQQLDMTLDMMRVYVSTVGAQLYAIANQSKAGS